MSECECECERVCACVINAANGAGTWPVCSVRVGVRVRECVRVSVIVNVCVRV